MVAFVVEASDAPIMDIDDVGGIRAAFPTIYSDQVERLLTIQTDSSQRPRQAPTFPSNNYQEFTLV